MHPKFSIGILLVMMTIQFCTSPNVKTMQEDSNAINKEAPFYTHRLPEGHPRIFKTYDSSKIETFRPFGIYKDGSYMVFLEIGRDPEVYNLYESVFEKYDYNGSGYEWAALVSMILKKEKPELISRVQFDPEGGGFYLFADGEQTQRQVAQCISDALGDVPKFESFLKSADRVKIENYNPEKD